MMTELQSVWAGAPRRTAVQSMRAGGWESTSWERLHANASAVAARARQLGDERPVVVVADATADSIATMLGLMSAGVDAMLLEENSSYLTDPASPVHDIDAQAIIGPKHVGYEQFRAEPDVVDGDGKAEVWQLTSGSTGVPRIARQPVSNVVVGGRLYQELFEMSEQDRVLIAVPVAHSYGLAGLCSALLSGATAVTLPRFSLSALVAGLEDGATMLLGTPLLYRLMTPILAARRSRLGLRTALSAGGPMPADDYRRAEAVLGTRIRQIYGTTEAGLVACVPQSASNWPAGSVGFPAPGVTMRLSDGETGRLFVRTPMMFNGYWGGGEHNGFYDTGDTVRIDQSGHMFVLGRKDTVVNIGGRKVSPQRVERVLSSHPAVREVAVYGVERPDQEQEMQAAIVLAPGTGVAEVLEFCRENALAAYEVPHRVHVLDRLPRNSMGKIDRNKLRSAAT